MEDKKYLTDEELDKVTETLESQRPENDILKIKEEVETNQDAELESAEKTVEVDAEAPDLMLATDDDMYINGGVSLFDLDGDQIIKEAEESDYDITTVDDKTKSALASEFDMNDDEILELFTTLSKMRRDNSYPVYSNLPKKIQKMVRDMATQLGRGPKEYDMLSRAIMNELIADANIDSAFVDLEKALNEALNIPSLVDLYSDHMKTVMEVNLPQMIENIKDEEPEKAELLRRVSESFKKSYTFSMAKEKYEQSNALRKAVRRVGRDEKLLKRSLNELNYKNEKSNFKFNDATEMPEVLHLILIEEPEKIFDLHKDEKDLIPEHVKRILDMQITSLDIDKFCIFISKSCEELNAKDIVDASYMYYMIKNIVVLRHTQEAKTDFAVELINNICDCITYLRNKEAEFYAANIQ